ncbi:MAG: serine/threonine protein kinase [Candidatus Obscuribacterales bacterium]|nr:serine/threonine protein kinase [Candidatus Obscuribacterales bacterium]
MPEPKAGSIFDKRYLILKELGAGGMGQVFHAKQVDAEREVALKLLRVSVQDDESKTRFFREFKVLSELNHPHIMTVYGLALGPDSTPYAICEYLEGTSLRTFLDNGALSWRAAAQITIEIAEALHYAHTSGIVHRDLKPENIMLVSKPHSNYVKLIDFGLSRIVQEGSQKLTGTGQLIGSPLYMSPEQSRQAADQRSDIYSLGCILFEMLSGQQLFPSAEAVSALYMHSNKSATNRFCNIVQQVPERLMNLLAEMLAKDPADRCQSADEVANRLRRVLDTPGESFSQSHQSKIPNRTKSLIAVGLILTAIAIPLLLAGSIKQQHKRPPSLVATPKSFAKELAAIDTEMNDAHTDQVEAMVLDVDSLRADKQQYKAWLWRLKELEPKARNNKERYAVYWLEAICYSELRDWPNRIKYLKLCLDQIPKNQDKKYTEKPGILGLIAMAFYNLNNIPEARRYALAADKESKEFGKWLDNGNEITQLAPSTLKQSAGWLVPQATSILAEMYFGEGNYEEASKYASRMHDLELTGFPFDGPGNATINSTLIYASCLAKMGKRAKAIKVVEHSIGKFNKPGEIPESIRPNNKKATAANILNLYGEVCNWLDEYEPKLALKYRAQAAEYAKFYHLESYWAQRQKPNPA